MPGLHVVAQAALGGVAFAAEPTDGLPAVSGHVLAAPVTVGERPAAAWHGTQPIFTPLLKLL